MIAAVLPITSLDGLAGLLGTIGILSALTTLTASVRERRKFRAEQRATAVEGLGEFARILSEHHPARVPPPGSSPSTIIRGGLGAGAARHHPRRTPR